jgi:hypothetical protein
MTRSRRLALAGQWVALCVPRDAQQKANIVNMRR